MDIKQFSHRWWGQGVPLLLTLISTLTPDHVRAVILFISVVWATITFSHTDFASKSWKKTASAAIVFSVVALAIFWGVYAWQGHKPKEAPPVPAGAGVSSAAPSAALSRSVSEDIPKKPKRPPRKETSPANKPPANQAPQGSIQSNSGEINVQQSTNGNDSPIVNSPITVNPGPPPRFLLSHPLNLVLLEIPLL
jgi:hypothetical protein